MNVVFSFNVIIEHRYSETQRFKIDNVGWRLKKMSYSKLIKGELRSILTLS